MARKIKAVRKKRQLIVTVPRPSKQATNKKKEKEVGLIGSALRTLGGLGGGAIGGLLGAPSTGSAVGRSLGATLSKWMGAGDYTVEQNSIVDSFKRSGTIPSMHSNGTSVIIRHKEYLGDVYSGGTLVGSNTAFSISGTYYLNPGLSASFPWLSTIATNFQEYTWKGLMYHYISTSGESVASANTTLGTVAMATNYRSTAPAYTSRLTMLNEYFSTDAKPSDCFVHPIECNPAENPFNVQYVRSTAVPAGEDPKTYDLGVTTIATQGQQTQSINLGELWVTYEVELRKPIAQGLLGSLTQWGTIVTTGTFSGTYYFGTATSSTTGPALMNIQPKAIVFNKGCQGLFLVLITAPTASLTATGTFAFTGTNCSITAAIEQAASTITSGGGYSTWWYEVNIPDGTLNATLTATAQGWAGSIASMTGMTFYATQTNLAF